MSVYNPSTRRMFESEFAKRFKYRGINAVESFTDIEIETLRDQNSQDAILAKIQKIGSDAVLIARVVDRRTKENIIHGMRITSRFGLWGTSTGASYAFPRPSAPTMQAYSHKETFSWLETNLFDARSEKLLWTIRTETRLSGPPPEEIKPYFALVAKKLFNAKMF